jgi:hypothetical protein
MRTVRSLGRFALSSVLVVGVMLGALLPPEHMHLAGIEGRTHSVVHRHSLQGSGSGPSATSIAAHGSHERALFLSTFYDSVARFLTHAPAVVETAIMLLPALGPLESVQADEAHRAHGPPSSPCPSRAPPSLA